MSLASVCIQSSYIAVFGASIDAQVHQHSAIQLVFPEKANVTLLNGDPLQSPVIIGSHVKHQLHMGSGLIMLIEPKSYLGRSLQRSLNGKAYYLFSDDHAQLQHDEIQPEKTLDETIQRLFSVLGFPQAQALPLHHAIKDKRITSLLQRFDDCLAGQCVKPEVWRAQEVASQLSLSTNRFLHLFRDHMGIPWRRYLLWRRMICAIQSMLAGSNATDAAFATGFSDSAHLSRTFKSNFGMTIRQAQKSFSKTS